MNLDYSYNKVDDLNLDVVKTKLAMTNQDGGYEWPEDAINMAIDAYRAFLKQALKNRFNNIDCILQPEPLADIVWHTHILFTQKYHQDCNVIFGEYLHHQPKII
ncbi:Uncharacterized conserved protein [Legionella beliardensis]|uniref:Uncharacterized conserved protein n=2 Tax=Legionella beliardensis TaxID=91822 RepID=A0A378HZG4_9GAMM|nr:Uncharacterized conserved protein [Legionella beliardensis]